MALSAFFDKELPPTDHQVAATLGRAAPLWKSVQAEIAQSIPNVSTAWGFTSKATGWSLRVKQGERIIVYLTPCSDHFLASLALGEKAVEAARAAKLPKPVLALIDAAPKYAEGRGVRFAVKSAADASNVVMLAAVKAAG